MNKDKYSSFFIALSIQLSEHCFSRKTGSCEYLFAQACQLIYIYLRPLIISSELKACEINRSLCVARSTCDLNNSILYVCKINVPVIVNMKRNKVACLGVDRCRDLDVLVVLCNGFNGSTLGIVKSDIDVACVLVVEGLLVADTGIKSRSSESC